MTAGFHIAPARSPADLAAVAGLFAGHAASLPVDLGYQDFDGELAALPGKYAPPPARCSSPATPPAPRSAASACARSRTTAAAR